MFSNLIKLFISYFLLIIFICIFFIPFFCSSTLYSTTKINSEYNFIWPIPGYYNISSYYGKRTIPTSGASTYHSGIDLPAPEGTKIYAIDDGKIYFSGWGAGGGFTISQILINYKDLKVSYCHLSPIMFIKTNDFVKKGQLIATVGPKNIYTINDNPYKDSNGNPTNGATTGCHLHFTIKKNDIAVNPLDYYSL